MATRHDETGSDRILVRPNEDGRRSLGVTRIAAESAARATAAALREEILARGEDGWFLGSEDDLIERLGVSRPTLRQAARILEHEQLLSVRRGLRGGLFARTPSSEPVAQVASVYLRSRQTSIAELTVAVGALSAELARLAAADPDADARASLLAWVEDYQARDRADEQRWFLATALEFGGRLAALSGNRPLALFEDVLNELAMAPFGVKIFAIRERIDTARAHHRRLAAAVRDGRQDAAAAAAKHQSATAMRWLAEDGLTDGDQVGSRRGRAP